MTRAPWVMAKPDGGFPRGPQTAYDTSLGWRLVNPRMAELYGTLQMGETAERVAAKYEVSREDQDEFALRSHQRAVAAQEAGRFDAELVPVAIPQRKGDAITVTADEGPRADSSLESLGAAQAGLPGRRDGHRRQRLAAQRRGVGSCPDGGGRGEAPGPPGARHLRRRGERGRRSRLHGHRARAGDPQGPRQGRHQRWGRGPGRAERGVRRPVRRLRPASWRWTSEKVNVNGGAIALGHPLGSSGSRLVCSLTHEMNRSGAEIGLATMCIGVGQGIASIWRRG